MDKLNLSAPTVPVFFVSVALAILALIGHFASAGFLTTQKFWIAILAYVVLLVGNLFKGL
jgi:type IV secretory pathway VirB3-like protein